MVIAAFTLAGGLVALLAAGNLVVTTSSALGRRLGLTPLVVGMTIVAAGTSAPELAVVGQALAVDDTELAVGSVIGSNIANILLVLGSAAIIGAIRVTNRAVRIDIPVMIAASATLVLMAQDGRIDRADGAILLVGLAAFVTWTVRAARASTGGPLPLAPPARSGAALRRRAESISLPRKLMRLGAGIAGLSVAARFVVDGAERLALLFGVPELIVGLTIVALGTSAPEIMTTVIAAIRGNRDLAVGNAVGSNIFNILLVLGAPALVASNGIAIGADAVGLDLPIMFAVAVACLPMVFFNNRLDRWEGAIFVAFYVAYLVFLVLDATGHRAKDPFAIVMVAFVVPLTLLTVATIAVRNRPGRVRPPRHERAPSPETPAAGEQRNPSDHLVDIAGRGSR